nr:PREDICTED: uncharacterized protein LOC100878368 [Megachile rotundata]
MNCKAMTDRISERMNVDKLYSNEWINLISSDSSLASDYDDDDDITYLNIVSHKSSHPVFVEACDDTSMSINDDTACDTIDIELLKTIDDDSKICQKLTPVPHKLEATVSHNFDEIRQEALQICNLLSNFKYETVYKALRRNYKAENRIELSLWDLLPNKRPRVKHFQDLSVHGMQNVLKNTSNSQTVCKNKNTAFQTNCVNGLQEHLARDSKVSSPTADGILDLAKLTINQKSQHTECVTSDSSFILPLSKSVTNANKHLETRTANSSMYVENYGNNKFNQKHVSSTKSEFKSNSTKPLINNNSTDRILFQYMQYLQYMQIVKQQKLTGEIKNFNFNQRNEARKLFLESHSSNLQDIDIQKIQNVANVPTSSVLKEGQVLSNGRRKKEQHSKSKKCAVERCNNIAVKYIPPKCQYVDERLAFAFPQIDKNSIKRICLNLENASSICSVGQLEIIAGRILDTIINFAGLFAIIKANTTCSKTAVVSVTNSNNLLSHPINFNDSLNRTNNTFTQASNRLSICPSNYPISKSQLAFGGAKKKVIGKKKITESNKDVEENIVLPLKFEKMYETLITVYPQLDKKFIRQTCKNISKVDDICSIEQLEALAVQTIQDKMQSTKANIKISHQEDDENKLYTSLSGIFPEADPAYLKKVIVRAKNRPSEIENFIQTQWDNPTYPTKQEKLEKMRITQQQMQCTKNFDVKQFLEIFPDPVKYFTNPERVCKFNSEAVTFLTSHFSHFEAPHLKDIYNVNKFNLTLTVQKLENTPPHKKLAGNIDSWGRYPPQDIPLLQECAYITHREEICEYLNKLKEAEMREFMALKSKNELLECQCCYDNECMPSKCSTCDDGHIFCNSCILRGTESQLGLGNTRISCFLNCDGEFTVPTLQKILPPTQFSIFIRKRQEQEVMAAKVVGLVSCPFCHFASIPPPEDKVFKCLNPECMKESCRLCKELNHVPLRCYEERSEKARLVLEEKMTEALVRKCYKCSKPYFKADGCNKIICQCGAMMCYICDTAIDSYAHFSSNGCPTYSDNYSINAETVRAVAEKTVEFLKKKDPHADIKADDLLKNLPSASPNAIRGRVNKITKFDE